MPKLDSIDSPYGELNEEIEIESDREDHSKILFEDQEEIEECSGEESAKVMLFDTFNSKSKQFMLRKMSSNDSFKDSIGSPTKNIEDQNSSIVELDIEESMKQLLKYNQCM